MRSLDIFLAIESNYSFNYFNYLPFCEADEQDYRKVIQNPIFMSYNLILDHSISAWN